MLPAKTAQSRWYDACVRPPPEIPRLNVMVAEDDGQTIMPASPLPLPAIRAADVAPEVEDADTRGVEYGQGNPARRKQHDFSPRETRRTARRA
jgi:hypothetical protein